MKAAAHECAAWHATPTTTATMPKRWNALLGRHCAQSVGYTKVKLERHHPTEFANPATKATNRTIAVMRLDAAQPPFCLMNLHHPTRRLVLLVAWPLVQKATTVTVQMACAVRVRGGARHARQQQHAQHVLRRLCSTEMGNARLDVGMDSRQQMVTARARTCQRAKKEQAALWVRRYALTVQRVTFVQAVMLPQNFARQAKSRKALRIVPQTVAKLPELISAVQSWLGFTATQVPVGICRVPPATRALASVIHLCAVTAGFSRTSSNQNVWQHFKLARLDSLKQHFQAAQATVHARWMSNHLYLLDVLHQARRPS